MKYKTRQYAEALAQALDGAEPEVARTRVRTFAELLKKHRMLGKADAIMRVAERSLAKRAGAVRVRVETADTPPASLQKEIAELFDGKVWIEESVHPELLAGVRILIDDEILVDASAKRQLAEMFQTQSRA